MVSGMKMIADFAEKISNTMVDRGIVQKEDVELYQYGIENSITVAGNLLASALFGILTGRLGVVLVFLLFYSTLRTYSGGVHCKSKLGCFILSMLILLVPVFSYEWVMEMVTFPVIFAVGVIAIVVILVLSPVESINKPLDDESSNGNENFAKAYITVVCVQMPPSPRGKVYALSYNPHFLTH